MEILVEVLSVDPAQGSILVGKLVSFDYGRSGNFHVKNNFRKIFRGVKFLRFILPANHHRINASICMLWSHPRNFPNLQYCNPYSTQYDL